MSELKAKSITPGGTRNVYLKSDVDKVIAKLKHKRCLRNAEGCLYKSWYYDEVHDRNASKRMWKWHNRWLSIADTFKEKSK